MTNSGLVCYPNLHDDKSLNIIDFMSFCTLGPPGTLGPSDAVHFEYVFPDGCTRLSVRQINDGTCSPRRALQIDFADFA